MADRPEGSAGAGGAGDGILRRRSWPGKPTSRTRLITIWTRARLTELRPDQCDLRPPRSEIFRVSQW